jgi:hypothetical protein
MGKPIATAKGIAFAFPDVCLTPVGSGTVPLPYPNIAQLTDAAPVSNLAGKGLLVGGDPVLLSTSTVPTSSGDEAGSAGGVSSGTIKGSCRITSSSSSVKYGPNGAGIVRFMDSTMQNNDNAQGKVLSAFPTVLVGD